MFFIIIIIININFTSGVTPANIIIITIVIIRNFEQNSFPITY
jgi:hypothetical protein